MAHVVRHRIEVDERRQVGEDGWKEDISQRTVCALPPGRWRDESEVVFDTCKCSVK